MTTYKYYCINDKCTQTPRKDVHIKKAQRSKELCEYCGQELKELGIVTNIYHIGTQESNKHKR
jgi:aspartate carbamoyltransferase regulatory subunit